MINASALATSSCSARCICSVVSTCVVARPFGGASSVGPVTRTTSAPRWLTASARAYPIRPLEGFVITRTGSRGSRVGPAVTTTRLPNHLLLLVCPSSRSAAAKMTSGSLMRPGRSLGPSASAPISGPTKRQPRAVSAVIFAAVAGFAYIASFMAGAASTGRSARASSKAVNRSSAIPMAQRARVLAVAGARMMRSECLARSMCASARPPSHSELSTGRPVSASNVSGRTNSAAAAVRATSTVAPASVSRRARIQLL